MTKISSTGLRVPFQYPPNSFASVSPIGPLDADDSFVNGLIPVKDISFQADFTPTTITIKPVSAPRYRYGGRWVDFDAESMGRVGPWSIRYPITDRRVARRIARDTGQRFRKIGREYVFRDVIPSCPPGITRRGGLEL